MKLKNNRILDPLFFSKVLHQLHAPLIIIDHLKTIRFVNEQYMKLTRFTENKLIEKHFKTLYEGEFDYTSEGENKIFLKTKQGMTIPQLANISFIKENGANYTIIIFTPHETSWVDPLTNLPTRSSFKRRMTNVLRKARQVDDFLALLFIDLDRFKFVNDTLGHSSGDELLKQVAVRLRSALPKEHLLTRVGGDEFAAVLHIETKNDGELIAVTIMETFQQPFLLRDIEIFLTASIGISYFPFDGDDIETLITNEDAAMYRAKKKGKNRVETAGGEISAGSFEKLLIENSLRKSVNNEELFLEFQPQINIKTNEVVGLESLVRWNHPELGPISPGDFIPIAEETGLIIPIGEWVWRKVCTKIKEWEKQGVPPIRISVNVSVQEFLQKDFDTKISLIVEEYGVKPSQIELELTESMFIHDLNSAINIMKKLRSLGFRFSIDDFGKGFSSLSYLQKLPINNIKIDRSFIKDIDTNPSSKILTKTITNLAHDLQLEVVVKGVETLPQLIHVKKTSCDMVQGFYFSKPLKENHVIDFLKTPIGSREK